MTDNYYFPLNANIMEDPTVCQLIADKGMKGFGTYIGILLALRRTTGYKAKTSTLNLMAMKLAAPPHLVKYLVYVSGLFIIEKNVKDRKTEYYFHSPYLCESMEKLEAARLKQSEAGKKGNAIRWGKNESDSDGNAIAEENRTEENRKEEKTATSSPWERFVDEAVREQSHIERIAMHSGMGMDFITYKDLIVKTFKEHVLVQGSQNRIDSQAEACNYFANFTRQGTPTNKRLRELVAQAKTPPKPGPDDPYRFETRDPATGARSYFGRPIPPDAPPRPNEAAMWHEETHRWYDY